MKKHLLLILTLSFFSHHAFAQCHGQDCKEKSNNYVKNGDFENDSAGILSDYQYTTTSSGGVGGYYGIFKDASQLTTAYYCPKDHTTGSGYMMAFDGFFDGTRLAWGQTIRGLDTGRTYYFNFWAAELGGGKDPATIQLQINGVFVSPKDTINTAAGTWVKRSLIWKSGSADTAAIRIIQYCSANSGNNFALDDIELYSCDTILAPPPLNLGPDKEICKGTSLTLNATLNFDSYLWDDQSKIFVRRVEQTGTYWVKTTYQGCKLSDTINITVDSSLVVDLGNDITVCDQVVTLDAGINNVTYKWNTGATTKSITADTSGAYTVTVTNQKACKDASTVSVIIGTPFTINLGPDEEMCKGDVRMIGLADTLKTYAWNTGDSTGQITVSDAGLYVLLARLDGCEDSDTIAVIEHALPVVSLGNDSAVCSGSTLVLDAGAGDRQYHWSTSDTNRTLEVGTSGTYYVQVTDENGCVNTDTFTLAELPLPDVVVSADGKPSVCFPDSVRLEITSAGLTGYTWYMDGMEISGETGSSIRTGASGVYHSEASDINGCIGVSNQMAVHINPLPDIVIHPKDKVTVVAVTTGFGVNADGGNYTYQWQEDRGSGFEDLREGSTYVNVKTDSFTISSTTIQMDGYKYRCMITSDSGCVIYSDPATLNIVMSVNDHHLKSQIKLYPNPSEGTLNVYSEGAILRTIQVLSLDGRLIAEKALEARELNTLQFDDLAAGSYLVVLTGKGDEVVRIHMMIR